MSNAFARASDAAINTTKQIFAEGRHELLGGWFGRHFEPHPIQQKQAADRDVASGDIHGNERGMDL